MCKNIIGKFLWDFKTLLLSAAKSTVAIQLKQLEDDLKVQKSDANTSEEHKANHSVSRSLSGLQAIVNLTGNNLSSSINTLQPNLEWNEYYDLLLATCETTGKYIVLSIDIE